MIRYRILKVVYNNKEVEYRVQYNPLFGFPFLWFTETYSSINPPHPDLFIPGLCKVNCVFSDYSSAEKCFYGFTNKNDVKVINKIALLKN